MIEREALGKFGAEFITNTTAVTNKSYCAITMLEDTTFTTLTCSNWVAGSVGSVDEGSGVTYPKGLTIFGRFTAVTLLTGKVICYNSANI